MRLASRAGPPSSRARTVTAMKLGVTPEISRWPPPSLPILAACKAVAAPVMIRAAKTAHDMKRSSWPEASAVMATISTVGASTMMIP